MSEQNLFQYIGREWEYYRIPIDNLIVERQVQGEQSWEDMLAKDRRFPFCYEKDPGNRNFMLSGQEVFDRIFPKRRFNHRAFNWQTFLRYNGDEGASEVHYEQVAIGEKTGLWVLKEIWRGHGVQESYESEFHIPDDYRDFYEFKDTTNYVTAPRTTNALTNKEILQKYTDTEWAANDKDGSYNHCFFMYYAIFKNEIFVRVKRDWYHKPYYKGLYSGKFPSAKFLHRGLQSIMTSVKYRAGHKVGGIRYQDIGLEVWIYMHSRVKNGEGTIYNVTKFIDTLEMNCQKQQGTFNFTLQHINRIEDFTIKTEVLASLFENDKRNMEGSGRNNANFWAKYLTINDIVWIKLEPLEVEEKDRQENFEIDKEHLEGQIYDMIGLIDSVTEIRRKHGLLELDVRVQGRDLCKLFIDDQTYFHPLAITKRGQMELSLSSTRDDILVKRNFITTSFDVLFAKTFQPIGSIISFWMTVLANMGVVKTNNNTGNGLFNGYRKKSRTRPIYDDEKEDFVDGPNEIERRSRFYNINWKGEQMTKSPKLFQIGLYQIVKLLIGKEITDRTVVDQSVGTPQGSFLGLFNKICQFPFVEVILDTYLDEYCVMVRKPPFAYKEIKSYIDEQVIIDIEDISVFGTELSFSKEIYTWFQLDPKGNYVGNADQIALSYCPIIQLDEYVKIWGSKRCYVTTNYMDREVLNENYGMYRDVIVRDLIELVRVYAHLPFTRTGTITLAHTDRRIKKGLFVRLKYTGEIFYVDSVQHRVQKSLQNSETIITVSRGMKEHLIKDEKLYKKDDENTYSYFNIVNFDVLKKTLDKVWLMKKEVVESKSEVSQFMGKGQGIINKDVFEFFMQRKQFDETWKSYRPLFREANNTLMA